MPAVDERDRARGGLVTGLFWGGVALAPLAAALLMLADGSGLLRAAVVLVVLAVVLIGLSITLRHDSAALRVEVEDVVLDEVEGVREDVRNDIAHAARATHKALVEKIAVLNGTVEALRGQVDLLRGQLEQAVPGVEAPQHPVVAHGVAGRPVGGGVLRHTETVHVTTRHTTVVDPNESLPGRGTVYGGTASSHAEPPSQRPETYVTGDDCAGRVKIPTPRSGDWSPPAIRPDPESTTGSWTEQLLRERFAQSRAGARPSDGRVLEGHVADAWRGDSHNGDGRGGETAGSRGTGGRRSREYDAVSDLPVDDERVTGLRATDRWAETRSDERGRELRLGERRASVEDTGLGTQVRIEDRWASVLRDEASRSQHVPQPRREHGGDDGGYWSERTWEATRAGEPGRWTQTHREFHGGQAAAQAALPAGPAEPSVSWTQDWDAHKPPIEQPSEGRQRGRDGWPAGEYSGSGRDEHRFGHAGGDGYGRSSGDGLGRSADDGYGSSARGGSERGRSGYDGAAGYGDDRGYDGRGYDGRGYDGGTDRAEPGRLDHGRSGSGRAERGRAAHSHYDYGWPEPGGAEHRGGDYGSTGHGVSDYASPGHGVSDYASPGHGVSDYASPGHGVSDYASTGHNASGYGGSGQGRPSYGGSDYDSSSYGASAYGGAGLDGPGYGSGDYGSGDYGSADGRDQRRDERDWRTDRGGDFPRRGGARSRLVDFEGTDDRWR